MNRFVTNVYNLKRPSMALSQDENNGTDQIKACFMKATAIESICWEESCTILNEVQQSEELLFGILFRLCGRTGKSFTDYEHLFISDVIPVVSGTNTTQ